MEDKSNDRIHRVVAALSHRVTADEVADALVHEVASALGARAASVFLFAEGRRLPGRSSSVGYPDELIARWGGLPRRRLAADAGGAQRRARVHASRARIRASTRRW